MSGIVDILEQEVYDPWIDTHSGKRVFLKHPDPDTIDIDDIAHALSHVPRFNGHTKHFYSVAEHCVRVAGECHYSARLLGLLHDASEAYLGDMVSPIKHLGSMKFFRTMDNRLQDGIERKYGLDDPYLMDVDEVKQIDMKMLSTEHRDLFAHPATDWGLPKPFDFKIRFT